MLGPRTSICLLALALAALSGCVERRFTVVSNPPGAMVLVDRQEVGAAPVTLPSRASTYYGAREFMLVKDGYEPLLVRQPIPAPWYGYFPLDFFAEHLWPGVITDERNFCYQLSPQRVVPAETVLQAGQNARARAAGIGGPPTLPPIGAPPPTSLPPGALPTQDVAPPPVASPPPAGASGAAAPGRTTGNPGRLEFD